MIASYECLLSILQFFLLIHGARALCYFPDGETIANQDTECFSDRLSFCCGQGFACMSNGLCKLTDYVVGAGPGHSEYVRGSCSDKNWGPNCPSFCVTTGRGDSLSGGMGLQKCEGNSNDQYYCLDRAVESFTATITDSNFASSLLCTSYSAQVVFQAAPTTVTIIGVQTTTSTSTSSSLATSLAMLPTPPATSSFSSPNATTSSADESSQPGVAIGAGIGVPLGVIAVALIVYFSWRYKRAKSRETKAMALNPTVPPSYTDYQPKYNAALEGDSVRQGPVEIGWSPRTPHELPGN